MITAPQPKFLEISLKNIIDVMARRGFYNLHYESGSYSSSTPSRLYFSHDSSFNDILVEFKVPTYDNNNVITSWDKEIFLNHYFVEQLEMIGIDLYGTKLFCEIKEGGG